MFPSILALALACGSPSPGEPMVAPAGEPAAEPASQTPAGQREDIDVAALKALLDAGPIDLIDVRTDGEYADGHVPGTRHIPMNKISPADFADRDKSSPLYFICQSGGRSGRVSDTFAAAGFQVVNIAGGTQAWRDAGYPVE